MDNNRPDRDARGRFVSDDDDRYSGRRASASHSGGGGGRYADDDDRGRGRSGWHGDPEGHADASRRGWDGRRDDEDDRRGSRGYDARDARGRFIDDDRGRYDSARGDDRGRYGRDDDRGGSSRGHGGWFGDSGGHAEAARRGWDGRRDPLALDYGRWTLADAATGDVVTQSTDLDVIERELRKGRR